MDRLKEDERSKQSMFEEGESVTINPQKSPVGEEIRFSAEGFNPCTPLTALITGPSNQTLTTIKKECNTDDQGRINFIESTDTWERGTYKFKVTGRSGKAEKMVEEQFELY